MKVPCVFAGLAFFLSWLLPNHYMPWLGAYQDALMLSALLLITVFAAWPVKHLKLSSFNLGVFLFALLPVLQWASGSVSFFGDALLASYYLLAFALALLLGNTCSNAATFPVVARYFVTILLLAAVLSVWIALRQWLLLSGSIWVADLPPKGRPFANLAQPNSLATLLCLGLASVWYLYEKHVLGRLTSSLIAVFLLFGLVLTQSRTPWLAGIAVLVFWSWKYYTRTIEIRLSPAAVAGWYLLFLSLTVIFPYLSASLLLQSPDLVARATASSRWPMYQQFYLAISHGPWTGYGVLQTPAAQVAITPVFAIKELTAYTHNIVLDLLVWFGPVIGGLAVLAGSFWLLQLARYSRQLESLFALLMAGFILTHSMLEYPHAYAIFLIPLGLVLGVAQKDYNAQKVFHIPSKLVGLISSCLIVIGLWVVYEYLIIEQDYRLMRFENANNGEIKAEQPAPDVILLTQLREYTRFARTPATTGMTDEELDWMQKVVYRFPFSSSLARYTEALAYNGKFDQAEHHALLLKLMHKPHFYQNLINRLLLQAEAQPELRMLLEHHGEKDTRPE